jgi:phosphatidylinositol-3-phosphatase
MRRIAFSLLTVLLLVACSLATTAPQPTASLEPPHPPTESSPSVKTATLTATSTTIPSPTVRPLVPNFAHIIVFFFENHEFDVIAGNPAMPNYNRYIRDNTLLTQYYAITHPSLPNYLAVFGGDTFQITTDCRNCFINAPSLPDQIEASGRTWRAYLEDMPKPCYIGDTATYAQNHNPFIYFDPIRLDPPRCSRSVVPLTQLDADLASGSLPNFVYIMPNTCNSAHDDYLSSSCDVDTTDRWLGGWMDKLNAYLEPRAAAEPALIVLTWDEGQGSHSCCGLPQNAGGRVATVLISPLAKSGFQDDTPYTHYSLLKTIEAAWGLSYLGHAADASNVLITAPWK